MIAAIYARNSTDQKGGNMAKVLKRTWLARGPSGRRVWKVSWGYTLQVCGEQERMFLAAWTQEDARTELAKRMLAKDTPLRQLVRHAGRQPDSTEGLARP